MDDRISLSLGRGDMKVVTTTETGVRAVVHVAGRHPAALCPACERPSMRTNGHGWRDVVDVVLTLVVTLSICVRRFLCENPDCPQRSFDERFEGIDRGGASHRPLGLVRRSGPGPGHGGRWPGICWSPSMTCASARRSAAPAGTSSNEGPPGRPPGHRRVQRAQELRYATVLPDPARGVVIDLAPGRDASAVLFFAGLFSHAERAKVQVVTIDCHAPDPGRGPGAVPQRPDRGRRLPRPPPGAGARAPRCAETPGTAGGRGALGWARCSRTPASPWPGPAIPL